MQRHLKAVWVVGFLSQLSGCTAPRVAHPDPGALARADAALLQGCYDCLHEARTGYQQLAVGHDRPALVARVFEADLLIAVREKELDLPASSTLTEAHRIARELPSEIEAEHYLALVDDVPLEELGLPRRAVAAFFRAHDGLRLDAERAWLSRGKLRAPVRDYLRLALACAYSTSRGVAPPAAANDEAGPQPGDPPLIAYRRAICGLEHAGELSAVRAHEPRFVESFLFTANMEIALAVREGPGQAKAHLAEAAARFPASPAITYLTASYDALVGDCGEALRFYDRTLAAQPAHERALLGRAVCLSTLGRAEDAIDAATRLIALGADNLGEAYFWRARSHYTLNRLAEARRDISAARAELVIADVLNLAGIIEHDQGDLDPAQADLEAAIAEAARDCTARWYLGLVHRRRKQWLQSGQAFEGAMVCYRERASDSASRLAVLQGRSDLDEAYRGREIARLEASITEDTRQQHAAALIAANDDAVGGDLAMAKTLAEIASQDPALADRVAKLRALIDRPTRPR